MPNVSLGNGRLAWWLILESARRARGNLIPVEERKIILITPWIRDVPVDHAMWSPTSISAALGKDSSEIELLSDVLVAMSTSLQFKIQICIRDEIGRTVPRRQSTRVDQEYTMLRKLQDKGIQALKIHRSHKKMLITPLGATTGSMNFTYAGTRINRENNHFYFKSKTQKITKRQPTMLSARLMEPFHILTMNESSGMNLRIATKRTLKPLQKLQTLNRLGTQWRKLHPQTLNRRMKQHPIKLHPQIKP